MTMHMSTRMHAIPLICAMLLWGCGSDSDGDSGSNSDSMNTGGAVEGMAGTNAEGGMDEPGEPDFGEMNAEGVIADNCLFDEAEAGKGQASRSKIFLEMWNGDRFIHTNCSGDRKAIWSFYPPGVWSLQELYGRTGIHQTVLSRSRARDCLDC